MACAVGVVAAAFFYFDLNAMPRPCTLFYSAYGFMMFECVH